MQDSSQEYISQGLFVQSIKATIGSANKVFCFSSDECESSQNLQLMFIFLEQQQKKMLSRES